MLGALKSKRKSRVNIQETRIPFNGLTNNRKANNGNNRNTRETRDLQESLISTNKRTNYSADKNIKYDC
jgi:predicted transglutaminase-like protease